MSNNWNAWALVFVAGLNTCIGSLLLKKSRLAATDSSIMSIILSPWLIAGLVFFGINVVVFTKALDKLPVSAAYPVLSGLGFSLIAIASSFLFGERLGFNQWIGIGMILAGVIIMSRS